MLKQLNYRKHKCSQELQWEVLGNKQICISLLTGVYRKVLRFNINKPVVWFLNIQVDLSDGVKRSFYELLSKKMLKHKHASVYMVMTSNSPIHIALPGGI